MPFTVITADKPSATFHNKVAEVKENTSKGIIEFGPGNALPNELLQITQDSPTATACLGRLTQFIAADGFSGEEESAFQVNDYQTADELLDEIASYEATFNGFALLIRYDGTKPVLFVQPFDKVTKLTKDAPDDEQLFAINPKRKGETGYKEDENILVPAWNPDRKDRGALYLTQASEYQKTQGELIYVYQRKAGQPHYPVPGYYAGEADLRTDAEYSRLENFKAQNDFQSSVIVKTFPLSRERPTREVILNGIVETVQTGEKSDKEKFDELLKSFTGKVSIENRKSIIHLEVPVEGAKDAVGVEPMNTTGNAPEMSGKRTGVEERVARWFEVPGVLIGLYKPGSIGDTKKIADEINLFNASLNPRQRRIQRTFRKIFGKLHPKLEWNISTLNPINYIETEVYQKMTDDEIRAIVGLPPIEKESDAESERILAALNAMSPLVATKVLNYMSPEQILKLIGLQPDPNAKPVEENRFNP